MSTEGTGRLESLLGRIAYLSPHEYDELCTLVRALQGTCETHRRSADSAHYALEQGTLEWVRDRKAMREAVERMHKAEAARGELLKEIDNLENSPLDSTAVLRKEVAFWRDNIEDWMRTVAVEDYAGLREDIRRLDEIRARAATKGE
jgi:hypothetical protein